MTTSEPAPIAEWTFVSEAAIPGDLAPMLVQGERPIAAFATPRDSAIFTNKRVIVRGARELLGKRADVYSLPYSGIVMWSTDHARTLDVYGELELWTRAGHIKIKIGKGVDIRRLDHLIAHVVLNGA
jgi:hypothetical protein